ncbi:tRNA 2-thiocytidine biosynthesis protein TtcA [Clostridium liquoris]|jgi:tRNA(Ile)-lysidine synthetase-like protein|uniref:tRNA 2-thiocytidine biosynthesis protein TtcA n=1 Tax=Clostridium liquoris TaxID=1289519 RepID=A0A2T0B5A3_9CLOT|nr:tRNA 2-thiocytidine biosynthesis TtcA family protein [Clostridium liquoris]PRR79052.1 tRNA 2-thiocytidine biosynthesis protein TtcA [Clostridium liquoris]
MITFERKYNRMFLRDVRDTIETYKMIKSEDRVAVGLSGGKDSVFLLFVLKLIQLTAIKDFTITGITIDMDLGMDFSPLKNFCDENEIPLIIEKTNIAHVVFNERKEKNPCSLCSKLRKGALIRVAKANDLNKLALGHNSDDVIETLFMNVLKVGKLGTFHPNIYYRDKDINIIRPLVKIREDFIQKFVQDNNFPIIKNLCPEDKKTTREEMKNLLIKLEKLYPDAQKKILTSLTNVDLKNMW